MGGRRTRAMCCARDPFLPRGRQGIDRELRQIAATVVENRPIGIIPTMSAAVCFAAFLIVNSLIGFAIVLLSASAGAIGLRLIPVHRVTLPEAERSLKVHATVLRTTSLMSSPHRPGIIRNTSRPALVQRLEHSSAAR